MVKKGFSLAETIVVMAIISIFFAAASKIITTKPEPKMQTNPHGYYECFMLAGILQQRYVRENVVSPREQVSVCHFEPPSGAAFFSINSQNYSVFQPQISNKLKIIIEPELKIKSENDILQIEADSSMTAQRFRDYLSVMYPNSEIYNGGNVRKGIIISW